jgi:hypothetical protein
MEAAYRITFARISVGGATLAAEFGESGYSMTFSGRAGGAMRFLLNGEALLAAHGIIRDGRPEPRLFTSSIKSENANQEVTMSLAGGDVTQLAVTPAAGGTEVSETGRRQIIDPLTAMLIWSGAAGEHLPDAACQHPLAVFDGRHRYGIKLAFKHLDKVAAAKGYAGPAIVCSLQYQPLAGHGTSAALVNYLSEGREMEIVLAPIGETRLLAPFRLSVAGMLANLVIEAERFEVAAPTPAAPPPADARGP